MADGRETGRVLVVEDEPMLQALVRDVLSRAGLAVTLVGSGEAAVAFYREHRPSVALVLINVRLPRMDGPDTLRALRQINPSVRVCFMSGHSARYSPAELLALGALHFFAKPYDIDELSDVVSRLVKEEVPAHGAGLPEAGAASGAPAS